MMRFDPFGWRRVVSRLDNEVDFLRGQLEAEQRRNDCLTEAIAAKSAVSLVMPHEQRVVLEPPSTWMDHLKYNSNVGPPVGNKKEIV